MKTYLWSRVVIAVGLIASVFGPTLAEASDSIHETHVCDVLTITPFQTAAYVQDKEAAALLDNLAEFSTKLLKWEDTPRDPVVAADRLVKEGYVPSYYAWRGDEVDAAELSVETITAKVSEGFRQLQSPRIVRLAIEDAIEFSSLRPVDVIEGEPTSIPFVVTNQRKTEIQLILRGQNAVEGEQQRLTTVKLYPQQTTGFWLALGGLISGDECLITAEVAGLSHELRIPVRHHQSGRLRIKVIDERGKPTSARIYLTAADRRAYAPKGVMQRMILADRKQAAPGESYFHTAGSFELLLPAGDARIEVVKGMEYLPVKKTVAVAPDGVTEIEIKLTRIADLAVEGWYSGDVHVHGNLFAQDVIGPSDVLAVAKAEDLNVINVLPCNDPRTATISDLQYFTGGPGPVSEGRHIVYYNEEMRNDLYGHVGFLNLKTFVEPAYFGWPHSPFPYDYPGNYPQVVKAKEQGAFVTYVHPGLPSEFPVDIALGLADTIDVMSQNDERVTTPLWYRLLNCGFKCPASAGTDSFLNIPYHLIPGAGRVYVKTGSEFSYANWIQAFKQGRTFVTNGPLLPFTFNGADPGQEFMVSQSSFEMEVEGLAQSIVPMEAVEIVVNGSVVRRIEAGNDPYMIPVKETLTFSKSAWVAVRTIGPGHRFVTNDQDVYAHTSPVYVTVDDLPLSSPEDARFFIDQIDVLISKMDTQGNFRDESQRNEIVTRFREAQGIYRAIGVGQAD